MTDPHWLEQLRAWLASEDKDPEDVQAFCDLVAGVSFPKAGYPYRSLLDERRDASALAAALEAKGLLPAEDMATVPPGSLRLLYDSASSVEQVSNGEPEEIHRRVVDRALALSARAQETVQAAIAETRRQLPRRTRLKLRIRRALGREATE